MAAGYVKNHPFFKVSQAVSKFREVNWEDHSDNGDDSGDSEEEEEEEDVDSDDNECDDK